MSISHVLQAKTTAAGEVARSSCRIPAVQRAADLMLAQHDVTYGPGGGTAKSRFRVAVKRPVGRVLAPAWVGR